MSNFLSNIQAFWKRHIFRVKHHLLYAAFAQIVILAINVLIFITNELQIPFSPLYCVVPTYFYLVLVVLYYLLAYRMNRKIHKQTFFTWIMIATLIAVNVIYTVIVTVDESSWFYYIDTVIVQAINAFYIMIYITANGRQFAQGKQLNLLRVFGYASAVCALLAFYFTFVDPMVMWSLIVITTVLLFGTYMIFHENFKKTLPKKKRLLSRAKKDLQTKGQEQ